MKEIVKVWLTEMLDERIEEEKIASSNERIWANGAQDEETAQMHLDNADNHEDMIYQLSQIKEEVENSDLTY